MKGEKYDQNVSKIRAGIQEAIDFDGRLCLAGSRVGMPYSVCDRPARQPTQGGLCTRTIVQYGIVLIAMAGVSLSMGALAGSYCATASCGFAKNLRYDLFGQVQNFSFENIDKFSTSSLVTRLTTDVANVQMAYMMIIRMAIRAPLMLIFAFTMAFLMGGKMAYIFVVVVPLLGGGLYWMIKKAMPLFRKVFVKYDNLNNSIQENIKGMRVVKSFVREDYEKKKFDAARRTSAPTSRRPSGS